MSVEKLQTKIEGIVSAAGLTDATVGLSDGRHVVPDILVSMDASITALVAKSKIPGSGVGMTLQLVQNHEAAAKTLTDAVNGNIEDPNFRKVVDDFLAKTPMDWLEVKSGEHTIPTRHKLHTVDDCADCRTAGKVTCDKCSGRGQNQCYHCAGGAQVSCGSCGQRGWHPCHRCGTAGHHWDHQQSRDVRCQLCHGTGSLGRCNTCHGTGWCDCNVCSATGHLRCNPCTGSGKLTCKPCSGHGKFVSTHEGRIKVARKISYRTAEGPDVTTAIAGYGDITEDSAYKPALKEIVHEPHRVKATFTATLPVTLMTVTDLASGPEEARKKYLIRAVGSGMQWINPPKFLDEMLAPRAQYLQHLPDDKIKETVDAMGGYELGKIMLECAAKDVDPMLVTYGGVLSVEFTKGMIKALKANLHRALNKPISDFWRGYVFWFALIALAVAVAWPIWLTPGRPLSTVFAPGALSISNTVFYSLLVGGIMTLVSVPLVRVAYSGLTKRWIHKLTGNKATSGVPVGKRGKAAFATAFVLASVMVGAVTVVPGLITASVASVTAAER